MIDPFAPRVGAVFSADIAVPEHGREVQFYSRVLSTGDNPLWREGDLMNSLGMPIMGLGALSAEYAHLPPQWMPHIQVADVATSVQRALHLGGNVLVHAKDDGGSSQGAVLLDPKGAAFGIIPVAAEQTPPTDGASPDAVTPVGRIYWLDLTVSDAPAIRDFYRQVVEWSVQDVEMRDGNARYTDYNMLGEDGNPVAGIRQARGLNAGLPPVWMIYLPAGDLVQSLHRVEEEGGKVLKKMYLTVALGVPQFIGDALARPDEDWTLAVGGQHALDGRAGEGPYEPVGSDTARNAHHSSDPLRERQGRPPCVPSERRSRPHVRRRLSGAQAGDRRGSGAVVPMALC